MKATNVQLSTIMRRAWAIKRTNALNLFSMCLQMAWAEYSQGTLVQHSAEQIKSQWEKLPIEAQQKWVLRMLKKEAKRIEAQGGAHIYTQWVESYGEDTLPLVNACYLEVLENLTIPKIEKAIAKKAERVEAQIEAGEAVKYFTYTLNALVNISCMRGLQKLYTSEVKHVKAKIASTDSEAVQKVSDASNVLQKLENAIDLEAFKSTLDQSNALVLDMLLKGRIQSDIAVVLGISQQAVADRIKRLRKAMAIAMAA